MVHIIDNYYAIPNNYGYTAAKDRGKTGKEGEPLYDTLGYFGTLEEVVTRVLQDITQNKASEGCIELREALHFIWQQTNRIEDAMKGINL